MFRFEGDPWWAACAYQLRAALKFIGSFGKRTWSVEDYPVVIKHRDRSPDLGARFLHYPWSVQIVNWWHMRGDGVTMELAIEDLRTKLSAYAADELPRPGTGLPLQITYASQDEIAKLEHVAAQFFPAVLEITNEKYHRRIFERYGVDVSDIESGNLVEILKRIDGKPLAGT